MVVKPLVLRILEGLLILQMVYYKHNGALLIADEKVLCIRRHFGGTFLMKTALKSSTEKLVAVEIPLDEVIALLIPITFQGICSANFTLQKYFGILHKFHAISVIIPYLGSEVPALGHRQSRCDPCQTPSPFSFPDIAAIGDPLHWNQQRMHSISAVRKMTIVITRWL